MVFFVSGESVKWLHPLKNIRNPEVTMEMVCDGLFVCICLFVGWLVSSCGGIRHGYPQAPPLFRRPWKLPLHPSLRDETNTDLHGTKRPEDVPSAPWPAAKGSRETPQSLQKAWSFFSFCWMSSSYNFFFP